MLGRSRRTVPGVRRRARPRRDHTARAVTALTCPVRSAAFGHAVRLERPGSAVGRSGTCQTRTGGHTVANTVSQSSAMLTTTHPSRSATAVIASSSVKVAALLS
jgi:hypothetical protein